MIIWLHQFTFCRPNKVIKLIKMTRIPRGFTPTSSDTSEKHVLNKKLKMLRFGDLSRCHISKTIIWSINEH